MHLSDWPVADDAAIDDALEAEMALARVLVSLGRAARADAKTGVRQPLPRAIALLTAGESVRDDVVDEIRDELNVKQFEVVASLEGLQAYKVVPNFRTLGPRLGKLAPRVKQAARVGRRRRGARRVRRGEAVHRSTSTARPSSSPPTTSRSAPSNTKA